MCVCVPRLQRLKEQGWNVDRTERKMLMCGVNLNTLTNTRAEANELAGGSFRQAGRQAVVRSQLTSSKILRDYSSRSERGRLLPPAGTADVFFSSPSVMSPGKHRWLFAHPTQPPLSHQPLTFVRVPLQPVPVAPQPGRPL